MSMDQSNENSGAMTTYVFLTNLSRSLRRLMEVPMLFPTLDCWKLQLIGSFAVVGFPRTEWFKINIWLISRKLHINLITTSKFHIANHHRPKRGIMKLQLKFDIHVLVFFIK